MKSPIRSLLGVAAMAAMLSAGSAFAEDRRVEETTTTTTTTQGTVTQLSPNAIIVQSPSSPSPVSYSQTKTTTYVDEMGNPVKIETVKSGTPVTVYYDRDAGQMRATRVVVQRVIKEDD